MHAHTCHSGPGRRIAILARYLDGIGGDDLVPAGLPLDEVLPRRRGGRAALAEGGCRAAGGLRFCPTGGIGADTAQAYLALANVACVGGSWVAPREAVSAGDWPGIERLVAAASQLKRP